MEICEEDHEPIVHNQTICPLCLANEQIVQKDSEIENLKEELTNQKES